MNRDDFRGAWQSALTVHGGIALGLACLAALYGLAVLTRPLGVLLLQLSQGRHL